MLLDTERGDERAAMYSLFLSAKPNGIDPQAFLRQVLIYIADDPINNKVGDLVP